MKVRNDLTVLERQLQEFTATTGKIVPEDAIPYIREANKSFAVKAVNNYRKKKNEEILWTLKKMPKIFALAHWRILKRWIRKQFLKLAIKEAQLKADTENYKIYVVRNSEFTFKLISTLDYKHNKKIKILKKSVDAIEMKKKAAYTAIPKPINHER